MKLNKNCSIKLRMSMIFAAGCLLAACAGDVKSANKAPPTQEAALGGFSVEPDSMALFTDGGEKLLKAVFSREAAAIAKVEWTSGDSSIADIQVNGETVSVLPKGAGNTTVTAKLVPLQKGTALNMEVTEIICPITVITEFKLDSQQLVFFEGDSAQSLVAQLPESVLQVAKIVWSVETAQANAVAVTGEGQTVSVSASGLEALGMITAKLEAINENAFNGAGRSAVCMVTSLEALNIEVPAASYTLDVGPSERTALITATYSPGRIDMWEPEVTWTSKNGAVARFDETSSVSLGRATTHIVAASVGTAEVEAELRVAGRSIKNTKQIQINGYQAAQPAVVSISIAPKPASLAKTEVSELITVTLAGASGAQPADPMVEWDVSETGVVEIIYDESSQNNTKARLQGVWKGEDSKTVRVTARSRSNTNVKEFFDVTVAPFTVTVKVPAGGSTILTKGGSITLNTEVNAQNKNIDHWKSDRLDLVTVTPSGAGNTNAQVTVRDSAVVTGETKIHIIAYAAADGGATSGAIQITMNPHTFKIIYHKNDGTQTPGVQVEYTYGDSAQRLRTVESFSWTKAGHTFKGWTLAAETENVALNDGALITALNSNAAAQEPDGTVNVYAKWESIVYTFTIHDAASWKEAMEMVNTEGSGTAEQIKQYLFTVTGNFELDGYGSEANPDISAQYISIRLTAATPKTLTFSGVRGRILTVTDNQKITINNINLIGSESNSGALVCIINSTSAGSAELVMEGSSSISGNKNDNTYAERIGGGVYIAGGTLTMKDDASIRDNKSARYGGGVFIDDGTVTMQDEAAVEYNEADDAGGGIAAYDYSNSVVNMSGYARINNNKVNNRGAGGGISQGVITMHDYASIYNNSASDAAGIYSTHTIKMYDNSTVHDNTASGSSGEGGGYGGGMYVKGNMYMYDNASVYSNKIIGNGIGGGVCVSGILIMTGSSSIHQNSSTGQGGGVYIYGSDRTYGLGMGGGTIRNNTSSTDTASHQIYRGGAKAKYGTAYFVPSEPPDLTAGQDIILSSGTSTSDNITVTGNGADITRSKN